MDANSWLCSALAFELFQVIFSMWKDHVERNGFPNARFSTLILGGAVLEDVPVAAAIAFPPDHPAWAGSSGGVARAGVRPAGSFPAWC